jgi:hypothetical protein
MRRAVSWHFGQGDGIELLSLEGFGAVLLVFVTKKRPNRLRFLPLRAITHSFWIGAIHFYAAWALSEVESFDFCYDLGDFHRLSPFFTLALI